MGAAAGFILSDDKKKALRDQLGIPSPHCYFCGSPYVCVIKGDKGPTRATCLVCDRTSLIEHSYNDVL